MQIQTIPIASLALDPANARKHPDRNLQQIKASLQRFGQQKPIIIDDKNIVRAGNGTLEAAISLGWETIAVVRSDLQKTELTAYAIADNRTAELAEWDEEILSQILLDEEIGNVGFNEEEIAAFTEEKLDPPDLDLPAEKWLIVITCKDETDQAELLERFSTDGLKCKALVG